MVYKSKSEGTSPLIGILHPGMMGVFVAASMVSSGNKVFWASKRRSSASAERAEKHGLRDSGDLASLCNQCDVLVSVCPPHAAFDVAEQVVKSSFNGIYLDANAISPQKAQTIAALMGRAGIDFVDGGIIGGPDWDRGRTRLYLSGEKADEIRLLFAGGMLQTATIGVEVGRASALKMCYAAYTKGTSALLTAIFALADTHQVKHELAARWEEDWPGLYGASDKRIRKAALKAWRFEGEMAEIAETFSEAGLPGDFHGGAGQIYNRLGEFKNSPELPDIDAIVNAVLNK